ncbi:MAG: TlpA family protein disulfide reductase [Sphaerochaeta sp.]|nr:TlpA family protein disulfide reductase [Sphaerochaeta sp.]MCI2045148.1 TlpA family protein disulfide reductase [Sphaerochaeta sp.]MCI2075838.1 TlpA family protein disulfide reductase [Sphaerochaeta sp.]MCI2096989.1 TlpA family protein disulfide reductase [Sphaerochaeta sp.]MCI2104354.1 TlpA family protein disulfide reductase [Sphaerochaeta sp.]
MRTRSVVLSLLLVFLLSVVPVFGADFTSFSGHDLSGRAVDQSLFANRKLTMVTVWATYCGYCREEMPSIAELQRAYPDLQVVGVVTDVLARNGKLLMGQVSLAQRILKQTGLEEVTLQPETSVMNAVGSLQGVPTKFYVDGTGKVIAGPIIGYQDKASMERDIIALLEKTT